MSEVEALIGKSADLVSIASEVRGWSPLSVATGSGDLAVDKVKALIAAGAKVSAVDKMGMHPIIGHAVVAMIEEDLQGLKAPQPQP